MVEVTRVRGGVFWWRGSEGGADGEGGRGFGRIGGDLSGYGTEGAVQTVGWSPTHLQVVQRILSSVTMVAELERYHGFMVGQLLGDGLLARHARCALLLDRRDRDLEHGRQRSTPGRWREVGRGGLK